MRTWLKVTIGIIVSLIIIFIVGGYIFYNSLTESLPVYEGELQAPSLKSEVKIYFVQSGDTLFQIAHDHGIALDELAKANQIDNVDLIRVGQELIIPNPVTGTSTEMSTPEP